MKKIALTTILVILISAFTFAQSPFLKNKEDSPSFPIPNQVGNLKVNYSTGAPSLSVPIYTATSGNLSLPVYLQYSTKGVRVNETPSEVGLSWRLVAGGSISQVVRGKNDFFKKSVAYQIDENTSNDILNRIVNGYEDAEPDLYIINIPGYSNSFSIGKDGEFVTTEQSNIKIEKIENATSYDYMKTGIKITLENGNKYYFYRINSYSYYSYDIGEEAHPRMSDTFFWLLTKIESANNTDSIKINYSEYWIDNEDVLFMCYGNHRLGRSELTYNVGTVNKSVTLQDFASDNIKIETIETNNEVIDFTISNIADLSPEYTIPYSIYGEITWPTYEEDCTRIDQVLSEINIKNTDNDTISKYKFSYYVTDNNRILLNKIQQENNMGEKLPPYKFNYYKPYLLCEIFSRFDVFDFWNFQNLQTSGSGFSYGYVECRLPNENSKIGMLTEVQYPTGAYTKYEYEANSYYLETDPNKDWYYQQWNEVLIDFGINTDVPVIGPGSRVKKITTFNNINDSSVVEFDYLQDNGKSSGRLTSYPILEYSFSYYKYYNSNNYGFEQSYVVYSKITEYVGGKNNEADNGKNGRIERSFSIKPPQLLPVDFPIPIYILRKKLNGNLLQKNVYDNKNKLISKQENTYYKNDYWNSWVKGYKLHTNFDDGFFHAPYVICAYKNFLSKTVSTSYDNEGDSLQSVTDYYYNDNNRLSEITQKNSTNDIIKTKLYYTEDYEYLYYKTKLIEKNILSTVYKKEIYKNDVQIAGTFTEFKIHETEENKKLIVPSKIKTWETNKWKITNYFDKYDDETNLLQAHGIEEINNSMVMGHNNKIPIATVVNAQANEVFNYDFASQQINKDWWMEGREGFQLVEHSNNPDMTILQLNKSVLNKTIDAQDINQDQKYIVSVKVLAPEGEALLTVDYKGDLENKQINASDEWQYIEIEADMSQNNNDHNFTISLCSTSNNPVYFFDPRLYPANAYMTSSTYKQLIGITSQTDVNGNTVFYRYDNFGRNINIQNNDNVIVKTTEYNNVEYEEFEEFKIIGPEQVRRNSIFSLEIYYDGQLPRGNEFRKYVWYNSEYEKIGTSNRFGISLNVGDETGYKTYFCRYYNNGFYSDYVKHIVRVVN